MSTDPLVCVGASTGQLTEYRCVPPSAVTHRERSEYCDISVTRTPYLVTDLAAPRIRSNVDCGCVRQDSWHLFRLVRTFFAEYRIDPRVSASVAKHDSLDESWRESSTALFDGHMTAIDDFADSSMNALTSLHRARTARLHRGPDDRLRIWRVLNIAV